LTATQTGAACSGSAVREHLTAWPAAQSLMSRASQPLVTGQSLRPTTVQAVIGCDCLLHAATALEIMAWLHIHAMMHHPLAALKTARAAGPHAGIAAELISNVLLHAALMERLIGSKAPRPAHVAAIEIANVTAIGPTNTAAIEATAVSAVEAADMAAVKSAHVPAAHTTATEVSTPHVAAAAEVAATHMAATAEVSTAAVTAAMSATATREGFRRHLGED
jgi:hypothetical protein